MKRMIMKTNEIHGNRRTKEGRTEPTPIFRETVQDSPKYKPHQGEREKARRLRQAEKARAK